MTQNVQPRVATCDPVWTQMREEALEVVSNEPMLASLLHATVLNHDRFEQALSYHLSQMLGSLDMRPMLLRQVIDEAFAADPEIGAAIRADIVAVYERDPACDAYLVPFLYFKGFHAIQAYRVAHWLWRHERKPLALYLQNRISTVLAVDIHPAARLGRGIMIDHGTGVVIGETSVVENDVSILQDVTLGGTGKETGDRHPKVREGAMIGAGAKVLGNIEVGRGARVAAGSVVLQAVPPCTTVAGVPARVVGKAGCDKPAREMDQLIMLDDAALMGAGGTGR
jgi:serine O-acetyltransferase